MENTLEVDFAKKTVKEYNFSQEKLLSILLDIQRSSLKNYISEISAKTVAKELNIPISKLYDVITFYSMLNLEPKGKYIIEICKSAGCHVRCCREKAKIFEDLLGVKVGQTTADGIFTLEYTSCFGACDLGPAAKIGEAIYGDLNFEKIQDIIKSYRGDEICQK